MNNLLKKISLDNNTKEKILPHLHTKYLEKGNKIFPTISLYYLSRGMVRECVVDDGGEEHTLQWYEEGQFFTTLHPTHYFLCLEDSQIIHINIKDLEYQDLRLLILQQVLFQYQITASLWKIKPAKLRILKFNSLFPKVAIKADKQHIANFLNITPSTLSRIESTLNQLNN
jgi:CRP-like cAMP-binding protein